MAESTEAILGQAHAFIEAGQLGRAQETLAPLLESEADNPALWWVYAHAVTDREIGMAALDRVLQLDPNYPGARELKDQAAAGPSALEPLAAPLSIATDSPLEDTSRIDEWEEIKPQLPPDPGSSGRSRAVVVILVIAIVAGVGAALVVTGVVDISPLTSLFATPTNAAITVGVDVTPDATARAEPAEAQLAPASDATALGASANQDDQATGEPVAAQSATPSPTASATPSPTRLPTSTALPGKVIAFVASLARKDSVMEVPIHLAASGSRYTEPGDTIVVSVCAKPGDEFGRRLSAVMMAAADMHHELPSGIDAFALDLQNCAEADAKSQLVGAPRSAIEAYATEAIDAKAFQQAWRAIS